MNQCCSNEDFNEIQQEISRVEDIYDVIAPCTQSVEYQDEDEGNQDLHSDFNEGNNLSGYTLYFN